MIGSRLIFTALAIAFIVSAPAQAGIFNRKPKPDTQKSKQLVDTLRADPVEARRSAAAADLREHDAKGNMEVLSALIGALQRDSSAAVRVQAATVLGEISPYSAQAGLALERTAEGDRSFEVREAAKAALWEYHLNGYRSQFFAERMTFQTAEPPLAKVSTIRPMAGAIPSLPSVMVRPPEIAVRVKPVPRLTPSVVPLEILPPLVSPPGPPTPGTASDPSLRLLIRPTFPFNRTDEPPLARKRVPASVGP